MPFSRRPLSVLAALILSVAGAGAAAVAGSSPASAATGCSVAYTVPSQWSTGFSTSITITNLGSPLTSWTLGYSYSGNQTLANGWSGNWTQSGANVTVTNASWNGSLATNGTVNIGANFNYSGTNTAPTTFTVNGVTCTGQVGGGSNTVTVTSPGNQATTVGTAVSLPVKATDSGSGQTLTFTATGLPAGLSISSAGVISGTPTAVGTSSVTVTAKDGTGASGSATFTWTITAVNGNTVTVTNPGTQTGTVGTAVSLTITATDSGSGQTLTFSATGLPAGLTISSTGVISGTPTTAATSSVTVTAKDGTGASGSASFSFVINPVASTGSAPQLHVSGNKLVDASGNTVVLRGIDRSGTEYSCVQGKGIFDGEVDQAAITAMKSWKVNAVRVPLNEACWNAESYVTAADAGTNYINAIKSFVSLLNSNGLVVILDLHWTDGTYTGAGAGSCTSANQAEAFCQKPMPDSAQSVPFWTSVASTFKGNNAVIFDLFNEPFPDQALGGSNTTAWNCLLNGGSACSSGIGFPVAGMQTLVNAVRSTGAGNIIMTGGLTWTNDLTQWLAFKPVDPDNNIVASWHSYNFNACVTQSCWTSQIAPVIAKVPLIAGEIGENDCAGTYITPLTTFLDSQGASYLGWAWNADFNCNSGPSLITDYVPGDATAFGAAYKAHLASVVP